MRRQNGDRFLVKLVILTLTQYAQKLLIIFIFAIHSNIKFGKIKMAMRIQKEVAIKLVKFFGWAIIFYKKEYHARLK